MWLHLWPCVLALCMALAFIMLDFMQLKLQLQMPIIWQQSCSPHCCLTLSRSRFISIAIRLFLFFSFFFSKIYQVPTPMYQSPHTNCVNVPLQIDAIISVCTSIPIRFDQQQQQLIIIANELLSKTLTNWFAVEQQRLRWLSCVCVFIHWCLVFPYRITWTNQKQWANKKTP